MRRATTPAGLIIVVSFFCGALTLAPAHTGAGHVITIIGVVGLVAELLRMSARNDWQALRSLPCPKWNAVELGLICLAVLDGLLIGPHILASAGDSELASYGLAAAVMVTVGALLFAANGSYRHRNSRAWR